MRNKILVLSAFSVISVLFFIFESFVPKPIPFLRIGLANIFILLILIKIDFSSAFIVLISKVILGNLFSGLLFTPIFLISLSGSILALLAMHFAIKSNLGFSLVGVSILGATFHNLAQISVARFVLIKSVKIFSLVPIMLLLSIVMGIITGIIVSVLNEKIKFELMYEKG
ncbi:MAG: Gx transporter family protein [Candidatus Cloacimonetes bacterium]|nr:Gx transporter family protein [Candidatus Cloacimonadota bacterium]